MRVRHFAVPANRRLGLFLGGLLLGTVVGLPLFLSRADSQSVRPSSERSLDQILDTAVTHADSLAIASSASRSFVELKPSEDGSLLMSTTNPAESRLRERNAGELLPTRERLRAAALLLTETLHSNGLEGSVVLFPQWGFNYRGSAPDFDLWVDVEVWPSAPGTLELLARREVFAYSLIEEDLGEGAPVGRVWLSGDVAYGHNAGPDPDEWVAIDLGTELFLVRVFHSGVGELLGRDKFLKDALSLVQELRSIGLSLESLAGSQAFADDADLAALVRIALETKCTTVCGPISVAGG